MRKFVISDIHGCVATFKSLLEQIGLIQDDHLYILGDYIDRGPDSKGVIDHIWKLQKEGIQINCLRGNHEQMMLDAFESEDKLHFWLRNGGLATLRSFGVSDLNQVPMQYVDWIKSLDYYISSDKYILVHAGLDFRRPEPLQNYHAMLWARNWYDEIDYKWLNDRIIVHGHTPTSLRKIKDAIDRVQDSSVLLVDNGCVYDIHGLGALIGLELHSYRLFVQSNVE